VIGDFVHQPESDLTWSCVSDDHSLSINTEKSTRRKHYFEGLRNERFWIANESTFFFVLSRREKLWNLPTKSNSNKVYVVSRREKLWNLPTKEQFK
jgi:hypothetical protein